ncbi:PREDICTED: acyl carrier protein, chloroplastic-like [Nicotiana attenuata]|uniref:Acyl carrier protein n=1 Tax=Nicotiana attenuata TaxID=49451 RepID=A0A1J6IPC1_NICAT|nr:PREDICTED: acyl carrier protein, chloroplastic-like [Nicotiana attenuata]OIT06554.1 acyl carrier protein sf2, chloroplastic [Nicotiana attenuata]
MASFVSTSAGPSATLLYSSTKPQCHVRQFNLGKNLGSKASVSGLRLVTSIQISRAAAKSPKLSHGLKNQISCSIQAQTETLDIVQITIAKQLSIDESTVTPQTKFADLGADSLDTVEIMMALEEKFEVSIGEEGAQNIATVQDAADLIEKVKAAEN